MIDLNITSTTSPDYTIKQVLVNQLALINIDSTIVQLFSKDIVLINDLITTNMHLNYHMDHEISIADMEDFIKIVKNSMILVSKHLRIYQRSTTTATPKNIFLNKVHNAYGIFLLEFNHILSTLEETIHTKRIRDESFEKLVNLPYTLSQPSLPKTPYPTPRPSKEIKNDDDCCYFWGKSKNQTVHPR